MHTQKYKLDNLSLRKIDEWKFKSISDSSSDSWGQGCLGRLSLPDFKDGVIDKVSIPVDSLFVIFKLADFEFSFCVISWAATAL